MFRIATTWWQHYTVLDSGAVRYSRYPARVNIWGVKFSVEVNHLDLMHSSAICLKFTVHITLGNLKRFQGVVKTLGHAWVSLKCTVTKTNLTHASNMLSEVLVLTVVWSFKCCGHRKIARSKILASLSVPCDLGGAACLIFWKEHNWKYLRS